MFKIYFSDKLTLLLEFNRIGAKLKIIFYDVTNNYFEDNVPKGTDEKRYRYENYAVELKP